MKRIILTMSAAGLAIAAAAVSGVAGAKEAGTSMTLSARHYHHWHHRHHHRGWWNHYAGCRIVIRHRINRWGERVVVRRRICY
jgi:hypothetical protein